MGGAYNVPGNISACAEFNVWFDPDSTKYVFENVMRTVVLPLDVTNRLQVPFVEIKTL